MREGFGVMSGVGKEGHVQEEWTLLLIPTKNVLHRATLSQSARYESFSFPHPNPGGSGFPA